ncbi:hypothetical protein [Prevotella nigrescens]|nr:hypothetical protein [Prevotella nigrescens]QUB51636.1 hypothetical protein J5A59_09940 [Prevotella nigrescens]
MIWELRNLPSSISPQHQSITAMKEFPIKTKAYYSSDQDNNNFMELYR